MADHWVCIPDEDLALILDGPEDDDDRDEWIALVQDIVEDGLETA